jgi:hypothetical protein
LLPIPSAKAGKTIYPPEYNNGSLLLGIVQQYSFSAPLEAATRQYFQDKLKASCIPQSAANTPPTEPNSAG